MRTLADVVHRFADYLAKESDESRRIWAKDINALFDRACAEDAFGTEMQLDPRGDHRE